MSTGYAYDGHGRTRAGTDEVARGCKHPARSLRCLSNTGVY